MTKLISVFLVVLAIFVSYRLYVYWDKVSTEQDLRAAEESRRKNFDPNALPGMPWELQESLTRSKAAGGDALRRWLAAHRSRLQDPRLAWIELDFVESIGRDSPNEARAVFKTVHDRIPTNSVIYPRIEKLIPVFE